ncbi:restriction endonuclease subunit S [Thiovibrio frasassiensis]|uniref:Restriction endonuclease subunit S n=1 Tax=Thiovibrio frasassiensis TaxID=2984131 RepID=A0A9X4RMC6_9BACT|nr:restriction endonuclease subunit S [Thiovibrio frasassiensis]MDG4476961.1 restriction endonuclease subunit S [Thiovibrio frasassiensis]
MKWATATIGEVCEVVSGATPKTGTPAFWDGDVPWVTPKDLSDNVQKYLTDTPRKITTAGLRSCSAKMLPADSVLFSSRAPIGLVAINKIPVCTNQGFKNMVPRNGILSPDYLYWWLDIHREDVQRLGRGATFKEVSKKIVEDIQIPLPPLAEQKRIAVILDAADGLRAKRRESLAQLDTLLQSTFLDMFGDPVTNPKGWRVVDFKEVGTSRLGKMLDKGKEAGNCQFPYLANFNVQWGRFVLDDLRRMDFTEKDRKEFELKDGDLLVCEGGEVGRTAIWRGEMKDVYFQKALHRVRLNPSKSVPEYVQQCMWFMAKNGGFRDFTNSATIAHLTGVKLKTVPFPQPPLDLQHRFATIVESIEQQKARLRSHLAELDTLFASLQQRAFNGELLP